jgi:hypothetical protein
MDFTAAELYIWMPLAFVYSYSLHAICKVIQPIETLYQQYVRRNQATKRRRLSNPGETPRQMTDLSTHTSQFLGKLPTEIRQAIYEICYKHSNFVLTREGVLPSKHVAWMHKKDWRYLREDPGIHRIYVQKGVLSLPLTCRQVYAESIDYVYGVPQFECFGVDDAFELPQILLPQRWQALTSFHFWFDISQIMGKTLGGRLREWERFWQALGKLPHLKRLEAHIATNPPFLTRHEGALFSNQDICDQVLKPLLIVTNIPKFEVWLSRRLIYMAKYTSAPFRLSWHEETTPQGPRTLMHLGEIGEFVSCERDGECCAMRF